MMRNTILVTGGTGKTGRHVARGLRAAGRDVRIATRNPRGVGEVAFDWNAPEKLGALVQSVSAIYLVAPIGVLDPAPVMCQFIDEALRQGVKRFVLLSASSLTENGPAMGAVHAYLRRNAREWAVLRPSWFMQNFSEGQHLPTIRAQSVVITATENGRVPFVDVEDIAAVGVRALLDSNPHNTDHLITGPRPIGYDEAAKIVAESSGRPVRHLRLSTLAIAERFTTLGLDPEYARVLAQMDEAIAQGAEDRTSDAVERLTGTPPRSFEDFAIQNACVWRAG